MVTLQCLLTGLGADAACGYIDRTSGEVQGDWRSLDWDGSQGGLRTWVERALEQSGAWVDVLGWQPEAVLCFVYFDREASRWDYELLKASEPVLAPCPRDGVFVAVSSESQPPRRGSLWKQLSLIAEAGTAFVSRLRELERLQSASAELRASLEVAQTDLAVVRSIQETESKLFDAALRCSNVDELLKALGDLLRLPMVLQNASFVKVAASADRLEHLLLRPERCSRTADAIARLRQEPSIRPLGPIGKASARLIVPVMSSVGDLLGFLVVGSANDSPELSASLERAARMVALFLMTEQLIQEGTDQDAQRFFLDVTCGDPSESALVYGRHLGCDLSRTHVPLVFRISGMSTVDEDCGAQMYALIRPLMRELSPVLPATPVIGRQDDDVAVFLPVHEPGFAEQFVAKVRAAAFEKGLRIRVGRGPDCRDVSTFPDNLGKARWAIEIADLLPGKPWCVNFESLGVYSLLFNKRDTSQLAEFVQRELGPLLDYDREHGTDLVPTLRCLLESNGMAQAATALYIHVSTLKYRVQRIQAVLGADPREPEVEFNLRLALRILQVQESLTDSVVTVQDRHP